MQIELKQFPNEFNGERCYVHARGLIKENGFGIITTQKLELSGCDVFYGIEMMTTNDFGNTFSDISYCKNLKRRYDLDGSSWVFCDATPFYHKKTGKIILTGGTAVYQANNSLMQIERPRATPFAVFNESINDFDECKIIEMPDKEKYFSSGAGCSQILELDNGELLIPFYFQSHEESLNTYACAKVAVMRCSFDGKDMKLLEIGNTLSVDVPRGLGEPSIIEFNGEYFMCIRNDVSGYVAKSKDGLNYYGLKELCFDDDKNMGNYNTQTHWLKGGDKLWLVYTRRAGNNDHVFRHRAPLFIAEFDTKNMRVIKDTEKIAVIERGARLGNFGCQSYSNEVGYVFVSEWMQQDGGVRENEWKECMKYGSDNSIFISKITY